MRPNFTLNVNQLKLTILLSALIIKAPIVIEIASPIAVVKYVSQNGAFVTSINSKAIMDIKIAASKIFIAYFPMLLFILGEIKYIEIVNISVSAVPKNRSYIPSGEYRLLINTPSVTAKIYRLLNIAK